MSKLRSFGGPTRDIQYIQECFLSFSLFNGYPTDPVIQSNLVFLLELALATVILVSDGV
jgi:hypothetical protein